MKNWRFKAPDIDPAQFDDNVALITEWNSMFGTSASFITHILVEKDENIVLYKSTTQNIAFCFGYLAIAGFAFFMTVFAAHSAMGALICGVFLIVGIILARDASGPMTFDKKQGVFYKGWRQSENTKKKTFARLREIHAVQLLENRSGAELNLVLEDGSRICTITNSSKRQIRIDGEQLSIFLGIPLWDGLPDLNENHQ